MGFGNPREALLRTPLPARSVQRPYLGRYGVPPGFGDVSPVSMSRAAARRAGFAARFRPSGDPSTDSYSGDSGPTDAELTAILNAHQGTGNSATSDSSAQSYSTDDNYNYTGGGPSQNQITAQELGLASTALGYAANTIQQVLQSGDQRARAQILGDIQNQTLQLQAQLAASHDATQVATLQQQLTDLHAAQYALTAAQTSSLVKYGAVAAGVGGLLYLGAKYLRR
jgi:hypothetical protein